MRRVGAGSVLCNIAKDTFFAPRWIFGIVRHAFCTTIKFEKINMVRLVRKRRSSARRYAKGKLLKRRRVSFKFKRSARRSPTWRKKCIAAMSDSHLSKRSVVKTDRATDVTEINYATRTLYQSIINNIEVFNAISQVTIGGLQPNKRISTVIDLKGWKIRLRVFNRFAEPLIFHYAFVTPRVEFNITSDRFFRDYNDSRDVNFGIGLTGTAMRYPLNPDKFHILFHKRMFIPRCNDPSGVLWNQGDRAQTNQREMEWYEPFNRKITFEDDLTGGFIDPSTPIIAMWWVDAPTAPANDPAVANAISFQQDVVINFSEKL